MLTKQSIRAVDINAKRVLMRVDFNVPLNKEGEITNTQRVDAALPTIQYALEKGAQSVVLMSHLGRPNGQKNAKYSLKPVAEYLSTKLPNCTFLEDCVGAEIESKC